MGPCPARPRRQNDLALNVTLPGDDFRHGNQFMPPFDQATDGVNNVESVFIDPPQAGTHRIEVRAHTIAQGPQGFALVVSGGLRP